MHNNPQSSDNNNVLYLLILIDISILTLDNYVIKSDQSFHNFFFQISTFVN